MSCSCRLDSRRYQHSYAQICPNNAQIFVIMAASWTKISQLHVTFYILADLLSSDKKNIHFSNTTALMSCSCRIDSRSFQRSYMPKYVQITPKYLSSWQPREPNQSAPYMDWWHDRTAYLGIEGTRTDRYEISVCPFKAIILMTSSISIYGQEGDKDWYRGLQIWAYHSEWSCAQTAHDDVAWWDVDVTSYMVYKRQVTEDQISLWNHHPLVVIDSTSSEQNV